MGLPLTIIGGFLGAGKTTLLKHLLENAEGRRLAVLINDFGALNIDAALIKATGTDSIELSNGCVCCSLGDDLVEQLVLLEKSAEKFDHVIIEASGVGDPWKIAQIGLVAGGYRLDSVIVVIDTTTIKQLIVDELTQDTAIRQLARADIVIANKSDLASDAERTKTRSLLAQHLKNDSYHWIETVHSRINVSVALGDYSLKRATAQNGFSRSMTTLQESPSFKALHFTTRSLKSRAEMEKLFGTISLSVWAQILRGKAIIQNYDGWIEWHKVGTRENWTEHQGSAPSASQLVLISKPVELELAKVFLRDGWQESPI